MYLYAFLPFQSPINCIIMSYVSLSYASYFLRAIHIINLTLKLH